MRLVVLNIYILLLSTLSAQDNLVPNPSFSEKYKCPTTLYDFNGYVKEWSIRSGYPEYHVCNRFFSEFIKSDSAYLTCNEYTEGLNYGGEYAQVKLIEELSSQKKYFISYKTVQSTYLQTPKIRYHRYNSGVWFTKDSSYGLFDTFYVKPQFWDTTTWVTDTSWVTICGCFQVEEALQWMVVGNFVNYRDYNNYTNPKQKGSVSAYDDYFLSEIEDTLRIKLSSQIVCTGDTVVLNSNHSPFKGSNLWTIEGTDSIYYHNAIQKISWAQPGRYKVNLEVKHCGGFFKTDSGVYITVLDRPKKNLNYKDTLYIREGDSIRLEACATSTKIVWKGSEYLSCSDCPNPIVSPKNSSIYYAEIGSGDCISSCTVIVIVVKKPSITLTVNKNEICEGNCIDFNFTSINNISDPQILIFGPENKNLKLSNKGSKICFNTSGTYTVFYKVFGLLDTVETEFLEKIIVYKIPQERMNIQKEFEIELGDKIQLEACSIAENYIWQSSFLDCTQCSQPTWEGIKSEKIELISYNGLQECQSSCLYQIKIKYKEPKIYIPNVISNNGDNINDELEIKGEYFVPLELAIYDRWGGKVYQSNSNFKWNGRYNDKYVLPGVYVIHLKYLNQQTGELESFTQDLTVLR